MRWLKDAKEGKLLVGGTGRGSESNQLSSPASISFDVQGHLYVVDRHNDRIQRFLIQ